MASRSTRNKVRFSALSALDELKRAEDHLARVAAMGIGHSEYIDDALPEIIAALSFVIQTLDKFYEGL
jgi:hypothetical protein